MKKQYAVTVTREERITAVIYVESTEGTLGRDLAHDKAMRFADEKWEQLIADSRGAITGRGYSVDAINEVVGAVVDVTV
jgi:hypothetical protein